MAAATGGTYNKGGGVGVAEAADTKREKEK